MNKKLLVIGCSFSCFMQQNGTLTWPFILSKKIDWHIYNSAIHGNSLQNQIYQLDYYLRNNIYDFIIFQATTSGRDCFILEENKYLDNLSNFEKQTDNYFTNFFRWQGPINYMYNMAGYNFSPKNSTEEKMFKLHLDNLVYNMYHLEPLFLALLHEIYRKLEESNIPYIYYCHIPFHACVGLNTQVVDFPYTNFCFEQKVGKEKFDSWRVDSGDHISDEGNYTLVNEYIYPLLEKYL